MRFSIYVIAIFFVVGCSDDGGLTGVSAKSSKHVTSQSPVSQESGTETYYNVTITNMTHSQPFSPGVIVTHDRGVKLFEVGQPASEGVRLIAENGDNSVAAAALVGLPGVTDVIATDAPIHRRGGPGDNRLSWTILANDGDVVSLAVMLICTNDGFAGLNSVDLPKGPSTSVEFAAAYDAGTEYNDELYTSIVDPCGAIGPVSVAGDGQNNRTATEGVVKMHDNIAGAGDLTDTYAWGNKVAQVKIKRVR